MTPELKAKWAAALRSGEYKQGHGELYTKSRNSFCCLGVLGCVLGKPLEAMDGRSQMGSASYDYVRAHIDQDVLRELAYQNDSGHTFAEIAAYIEAHL